MSAIMESGNTVPPNPDTLTFIDVHQSSYVCPSSTEMSSSGSDHVANDHVSPTPELTNALRQNVTVLQSSRDERAVGDPTKFTCCHASVSKSEIKGLVSDARPENNDQSAVNCATDAVQEVYQQCASQACINVQQEKPSENTQTTLTLDTEGCKTRDSSVEPTTLTDAEAVSEAVKMHNTLVADIDRNLMKMDCGQLAELPQYLKLKQLCQHLQVCLMYAK